MREAIKNAVEWRRNSQSVTELGYLLGYDEKQMDDLFNELKDRGMKVRV